MAKASRHKHSGCECVQRLQASGVIPKGGDSLPHRGFSMLGMLITLVCIVVLFAISMTAINKAVTGEGSARQGTVFSVVDETKLRSLHLAATLAGNENRDSRFTVPSIVTGSNDIRQDTTANLFSAMIALRYTNTENVISANEYNPAVFQMQAYNYNAYDPARGSFWDPAFQADLSRDSHVSFAHMPLYGERFDRGWKSNFDSNALLIGNRGPKNGVDDPGSFSYGRSGVWGGHMLFGDGRISFSHTFTLPNLTFERSGQHYQDNIFAMEDGARGRDAILSFTKAMNSGGPELQWD